MHLIFRPFIPTKIPVFASQFNKAFFTCPSVPLFALVSQIEDVGAVSVEAEEVAMGQGPLADVTRKLVGQLNAWILRRGPFGPLVL
tara:strand:- start:521 stop:778 length:258 start_codon:yes stop_codon:yes gene_type:complete